MQKRKVFIMGFLKAGTSSLDYTLKKLGYKTAHWKVKEGFVGQLMYKAYNEKKDILYYLKGYNAFTQMDVCYRGINYWPQLKLYKEIYKQYPNALYILNYRNFNNHLRSISKWGDLRKRISTANFKGKNSNKIFEEWIEKHYKNIREFFGDKLNFIEFDIENGNKEKLATFLGVNNIVYVRKNKGKY